MTDAGKTLSEDEELLYVLQTVLDWDPTSGVPLPVDPNTRCAAGGSTVLNMLVRVHIPTPLFFYEGDNNAVLSSLLILRHTL